MVCVAAFIVLCLIGIFVAFLSIFRRDIGRKYWQVFKKAGGCVGKKVRLQKCDTNFKDDVKNTLLKKVVLKKPKLVKPLSITIEVTAILIVFVTIWSLVETVKAGLALWTFGTCNVSQPASCALGAEACSIDEDEPKNIIESTGRWFSEWGEIFGAIPDRLKDWHAEDYTPTPYTLLNKIEPDASTAERSALDTLPLAVDIIDPGCSVCMQSYKNQLSSGFMDTHRVALVPYAIEKEDGSYKFPNSGIVVRYLLADPLLREDVSKKNQSDDSNPDDEQLDITTLEKADLARNILNRIFTESNEDGINYQAVLNDELSEEKAEDLLKSWLKEWGLSDAQVDTYVDFTHSDQVTKRMTDIKDMVENKIHAKSIPTLIYDGQKHNGLFKA